MRLLLSVLTLGVLTFAHSGAQEECEKTIAKDSEIVAKGQIDGTIVNKYPLLLTVGMDEALETSALNFGLTGFQTILGLNADQIEDFRQGAIAWFDERFGIDFSAGVYDPSTGVTSIGIANLIPLYFEGTYRVLSSNNSDIHHFNREHPSVVRLAEFVCEFNEGADFSYGGTYANAGPVTGSDTDNLAYGCYRIFLNKKQTEFYSFFMRSWYPDTTEPINATPARSIERFQMNSPVWGPGFGILNVAVPAAPDSNNQFPTYTRASWSFPGSFVLPDLNGYTSDQTPVRFHH